MKKYILLSIFCIPLLAWSQTDSIPLFLGKTCQSETFCIDSVTCNILPFKLTCEAKSRSKKLPFLTYSYQVDWDSDGKIDLKGTSASVNLNATNGLKLGKHKIMWRVTDVDSRSSVCEKDFEVKDCVKPQIFAKDSIIYSKLDPNDCRKFFSARDLVDSVYDNCSDSLHLLSKVQRGKTGIIGIDSIYRLDSTARMDYLESGGFLTIFAIDESGNWSQKVVYVRLKITFAYDCGDLGNPVFGSIESEQGQPIVNYDLVINGVVKSISHLSGFYNLALKRFRTYKLEVRKKDDPTNGVTTSDLIAINKVILHLDTLQTPYRYLAGDVNNDKKLSTSDLVELRKVILRIKDTFDFVDSWRFILKYYKFSSNPLVDSYPVSLTFRPDSTVQADFTGIKMGDVNGSAKANGLQESADRSSPSISYLLRDQTLFANQPINLRLPISELFQKDGFQFAIKIDPARATCMSVDGIEADSYSFDPLAGELLVSYVNGFSTGKELILQILPKADGRLQDLLTFPTDKLVPEFYFNGEETRFAFGFDESEAARFGAFPNPFSGSTTLRLFATKAEVIEYSLYEANGRLVWRKSYPAVAGWNEVLIDGNELPGGGIYYIQAKMEQGVLTEKLIHLH